jgi:hypothetical protein
MGRRWRAMAVAVGCAVPMLVTACGNTGPPDFALALAPGQPAAVSVAQGGTATVSFEVSAVRNSKGSIALTLSGLPTGVGVAPGMATVGIGSTQQFVLTAAGSAAVTTAPVTLTATGVSGNALNADSITHTQTVTLSVAVQP